MPDNTFSQQLCTLWWRYPWTVEPFLESAETCQVLLRTLQPMVEVFHWPVAPSVSSHPTLLSTSETTMLSSMEEQSLWQMSHFGTAHSDNNPGYLTQGNTVSSSPLICLILLSTLFWKTTLQKRQVQHYMEGWWTGVTF